jgi:hypothetical protein
MFWKKKQVNEEPPSSVSWSREENGILKFVLEGKIDQEEFSALQAAGAKMMDEDGQVKVLMVLQKFFGATGQVGADLEFFAKYDSQIEKIAVVGDPQYEDNALGFLGAGYRKAEVKFFEPSGAAQAVAWLNTP